MNLLQHLFLHGLVFMWRKFIPDDRSSNPENPLEDFTALLSYINHLADHKLGYPVSLLTYLGVIDNQVLGIKPDSLANILLNNVGDPFKDSETSLMEVKRHERVCRGHISCRTTLFLFCVFGLYIVTGSCTHRSRCVCSRCVV